MGARLNMTGDVIVAISAFRSDEAVVALLASILADPHLEVSHVIVVDSQGSGAIQQRISERGWQVVYENSTCNLGSAGNLARRIELARDLGSQWCLCLNHDANWSSSRLTNMLAVARSQPRVGAVYPVLNHSPREPAWEDGRRNFEPSAGMRVDKPPLGNGDREVRWSSSNGALYATPPLSEGVAVMHELWMGYEDLAYGIGLFLAGWRQLMCREAVLAEIFDYRIAEVIGRTMYIPDKPSWYQFYDIRNLILIRRKYGRGGVSLYSIMRKIFRSLLRIVLMEKEKMRRLRFLGAGLAAGLRGFEGKWIKP